MASGSTSIRPDHPRWPGPTNASRASTRPGYFSHRRLRPPPSRLTRLKTPAHRPVPPPHANHLLRHPGSTSHQRDTATPQNPARSPQHQSTPRFVQMRHQPGELLRRHRLDPLHHNSPLRPQQPYKKPTLLLGSSLVSPNDVREGLSQASPSPPRSAWRQLPPVSARRAAAVQRRRAATRWSTAATPASTPTTAVMPAHPAKPAAAPNGTAHAAPTRRSTTRPLPNSAR